jgi:ABC-type multidrug transport system ATPase subunit
MTRREISLWVGLTAWHLKKQVYELFNKVLILSQGETVYFGGTKHILHWFETALDR